MEHISLWCVLMMLITLVKSHTVKKEIETSLVPSKEVSLDVNTGKT